MADRVDLRSDTVTQPTAAMREAMARAEVGDDVFGEDPTLRRLEEKAAEILGLEGALFVPSGTMGNQIAVRLHTSPGQEVIMEASGHIFDWEMASMSMISGCLARPVRAPQGILTWELIEPHLSPPVYYRARTGLIALENTHNMAGGKVLPLEGTREILEEAGRRDLPVHLDGARIFNASVASGFTVGELCRGFDSVMFCLSKGLSAPVGSVLLGDRAFIQEARRVRKALGGGMRQAGILAAAGLVALEDMPGRLAEDHENARRLAEGLAESASLRISPDEVETNIVIVELLEGEPGRLLEDLRREGILAVAVGSRTLRFVTHRGVSSSDIERTLESIRRLLSS